MHQVIRITRYDDAGNISQANVIECFSPYDLGVALTEWVREEIDPNAETLLFGPDDVDDMPQ